RGEDHVVGGGDVPVGVEVGGADETNVGGLEARVDELEELAEAVDAGLADVGDALAAGPGDAVGRAPAVAGAPEVLDEDEVVLALIQVRGGADGRGAVVGVAALELGEAATGGDEDVHRAA